MATTSSSTQARGTAQTAKDKAGQMATKVQEKAAPVVEDVKAQAGSVAEQAQEKAGDLASRAQEKAKSRLAEGKDRAATALGSVAEALHETGESLKEKEGEYTGTIGDYTQQASEKLSRLTDQLQNADVDELLHGAEDFGRRDPALFLGAAFTIGVLGARFLKSSSSRRREPSGGNFNSNTYNSASQRTRALPAADNRSGDSMAGDSLNAPRNTAIAPSNFPAAGSTPAGQNKQGA